MAIERLSLPEGIPILSLEKMSTVVHFLLAIQRSEILRLETGEYDVTPPIVKGKGAVDQLIVLDNGEGIYRSLSDMSVRSTAINFGHRGGYEEKEAGLGTLIHLPQDMPGLQITAPDPSLPNVLSLYEIIKWYPD